LLDNARASFDQDERAALYCEAQKLIWDGVSRRIPLYHLVDIYAYNPKVRGWSPRHDKLMPLGEVWLDQ
jgi:ABC-type transport system substrate-binding protein